MFQRILCVLRKKNTNRKQTEKMLTVKQFSTEGILSENSTTYLQAGRVQRSLGY